VQLSSRIVRNSIANYGGNFVGLAVGFLLTPFLVHSLGDDAYGSWVLVGSISSYFWLLDFGLGSSVIKFVAELKAKGEQQRLNSVVASSFAMLAVVGVVGFFGCLVLAQFVDKVFRLSPGIVGQVRTMIYITGVVLLVSFPFGVFGGVLRGYQRYDLINGVGIASTAANAVMSYAVVRMELGLPGLALVGLITNVLVGGSRVILAMRADRDLRPTFGLIRLDTLREITGFSAWVFVINIAVAVVYRTSPIIIGVVLSVALVTPFSIANSLVQYVRRFVDPILSVLLPAYSELSATDDLATVRRLFLEGSRVVGAISMPMVLGLLLLGKPFIYLWMGPGYEQSYTVLYLLTPPLFISFLVATGDKLLWARGKIRVNSYVAVADTVTNLSLSVALAIPFGIAGVAAASLISVGITNGMWLLPYICREAGVTRGSYLLDVGRSVLLPAIPAAALTMGALRFVGVDGYPQLFLLAALCAGSYWALFLAASRREERSKWVSVVRTALFPNRAGSAKVVA
jgi:O-antigen/teichoic acid export membrane protein